MQYSIIWRDNVSIFNLWNSPALFTADNIHPSVERAIPAASLLLYHCYFPSTCLPGVALEFVYRRFWNARLETLSPLLGAMTTEGLYVTCHILTYKTDLLSSLLTIFARLQKEQYLRLFCYTTANFRAPVCQQWLLNSCTVAFRTHCWKRWFPPLQGDMTIEELCFTGDISGLASCYWLHTNSCNCWLNPQAANLSYQYAANRKIWPQTDFQTSSGRKQLVEMAQLCKLHPTTAGLYSGVKYYMQYFNNSKT